ncbi:DNA-3-methyladenine glycosylase 2 family protein, partial [Streptomyces albiflaviniger]|nr:DNA-3-methyladenine glycosylase 2 family protein [Streptomyces albiflaviniger]
AHTARILLQTTALRASEIAFAAGFSSVRQFNDTLREIYAATPTELRAARPEKSALSGPTGAPGGVLGTNGGTNGGTAGVPLRLAYRGPYDTTQVFDYLARRALTGLEEMVGAPGARTYRRTLRLPHA